MIYLGVLFGIVYLVIMGIILNGIYECAKELDAISGAGYTKEQAEKFNREWDEKQRRMVHKLLYDDTDLSKNCDVEYEDVTNVKLLEK